MTLSILVTAACAPKPFLAVYQGFPLMALAALFLQFHIESLSDGDAGPGWSWPGYLAR